MRAAPRELPLGLEHPLQQARLAEEGFPVAQQLADPVPAQRLDPEREQEN